MSRGAAEDILVHAYQCVAKVGGQRENKVAPPQETALRLSLLYVSLGL